jgi:hypothetical protein
MTPTSPPSSREPTSSIATSRLTIGGRVQRDVRLQAALALLVGIAVVAVPLFIWGRGRKRATAPEPAASMSAMVEEAGPPTVIFGDAGAAVAVDAGGRTLTFGEPKYFRCQDPGPGKTPPEKCDHLGPIEELITKAIAERGAACVPPLPSAQTVNVYVDVSFKRKKMRVKEARDGSSMPAALRKKFFACVEKGLVAPSWDTIGHLHQRYQFTFLATLGPSASIPPQ